MRFYFLNLDSDPQLENGEYVIFEVTEACELVLITRRGDTTRFKTRMLGVANFDAAEIQESARQYLLTLISNPVRVRLDRRRIARDQSCLAHVYRNDRLLSEELVEKGLLRRLRHDSDNCQITCLLRKAEQQAKLDRVGFWSGFHAAMGT